MDLLAAARDFGHAEAYGLIVTGLFLLAGFAAHVLGRRVHVPRVFMGCTSRPTRSKWSRTSFICGSPKKRPHAAGD